MKKLLKIFLAILIIPLLFLIQGIIEIDVGSMIFFIISIGVVIFSIYLIKKEFKSSSKIKKILLIVLLLVSLLFASPTLFLILALILGL